MGSAEQNKKPTHAVLKVDLFNKVFDYIVAQPYKDVAELVEILSQQTLFADLPDNKQPTNEPDNPKPKKEQQDEKSK
jgi:hypothetical protein